MHQSLLIIIAYSRLLQSLLGCGKTPWFCHRKLCNSKLQWLYISCYITNTGWAECILARNMSFKWISLIRGTHFSVCSLCSLVYAGMTKLRWNKKKTALYIFSNYIIYKATANLSRRDPGRWRNRDAARNEHRKYSFVSSSFYVTLITLIYGSLELNVSANTLLDSKWTNIHSSIPRIS